MNFEEFLKKDEPETETPEMAEGEEEVIEAPELDVQKAVVEELAADKAALDEKVAAQTNALKAKDEELASLNAENIDLKARLAKLENTQSQLEATQAQLEAVRTQLETTRTELETLNDDKQKIDVFKTEVEALKKLNGALEMRLAAEQAKKIDEQDRNPNALALLDREAELPDRFPGETRDHVLEVIREARDKAEKEGYARRAQLFEAVLVANEPNGTLAKKRAELEKLFADNGNLITGAVLEALKNLGISHKNGEEYLLPSEILKRTY